MSSSSGLLLLLQLLLLLLLLLVPNDVASQQQRPPPDCPSKCGNISIPYPFGIGRSCSLSEDFALECIDNTAFFKRVLNDTNQVLDISIDGQVSVHLPISWRCYNGSSQEPYDSNPRFSSDLSGSFTLSTSRNRFTVLGCDSIALLMLFQDEGPGSGCATTCTGLDQVGANGTCSGVGCCQTTIPKGFQYATPMFKSVYNNFMTQKFNNCTYAFVTDADKFTFDSSLLSSDRLRREGRAPAVLDWHISGFCDTKNKTEYACQSINSVCNQLEGLVAHSGGTYRCNCSRGYEGNPYLVDGCRDIDECKDREKYPCKGDCTNTPGSYICSCPAGTSGDPLVQCYPNSRSKLAIGLGIGVGSGLGILLLLGGVILLVKKLKKRKARMLRQKHFIKNHGLLLQQLISSNEADTHKTKIFSLKDLEKATNNFDETLIIGRGGHGLVYKGLLSDQRVAAIKKSKITDHTEIVQFINEVVLLSQINHRNVVKLLGCCLETEVPLLVYEFISNGTLSDHLHIWKRNGSLSWDVRLRIAVEVARALAYLHSAASSPIFHRDMKSSNILLDDYLTVKVSDFGASKIVRNDQTHVTTAVQGTFGYLDPEYFHTGQLTEKSDVYGVGVILVELLTGETPISRSRSDEDRSLTSQFMCALKESRLDQIVETAIIKDAMEEEIKEVAILAERCLRLRGEERPTMKEIELKLEEIRRSKQQSAASRNQQEIESFLLS